MSDFHFGWEDYNLDYYPHEDVRNEQDYIDWSKVDRVDIDCETFVREQTCEHVSMRTFDSMETALSIVEKEVEIEGLRQRAMKLEELMHDMFAYIDNCCFECIDPVDCVYYDKARDWCTKASSLKQRMKELGVEVIDDER